MNTPRPKEIPDCAQEVVDLLPGIEPTNLRPWDDIYKDRVQRQEDPTIGHAFDTEYGRRLLARIKDDDELIHQLQELLQDQILVDLGAGPFLNGYTIAGIAKARGYIGVEPYFSHGLAKKISAAKPCLPFAIAAEDMLTFLRRLPDGSCSLLMSGIDPLITPSDTYDEAVETEMQRVLHPEGACLLYGYTLRKHIQIPCIQPPKRGHHSMQIHSHRFPKEEFVEKTGRLTSLARDLAHKILRE